MPFTEALAKAIQSGDISIVAPLIIEEKAWDDPNQEGLKPIHLAIDYGHLNLVDWFLKNGVSLECASIHDGPTPLHRAALTGQDKIIEHLLKFYQDNPNKKLADGVTPLYLAAFEGHTTTAALLLKRGADIHQANNNGASPLFIAASKGHTAMVALLLDHHADIQQERNDGVTPLVIAASNGHTPTVALLLDRHADIRQERNDGVSSLYMAAQNGYTATVALLLEHNADIRQVKNDGRSPLYVAAQQGHTAIVALLLDHHADIHQVTKNGASPLHAAAQNGHTATVALLLDHHADIRQITDDGASPLYNAAQNGHTETVALLLDRNADILQATYDGISPLIIAAYNGHAVTVKLLLERNADVRQTTSFGASALYVAAQNGHTAIVALMLDRNADIRQATNNGASMLYIAAQNGHIETVALLLERNADINQATIRGESPLFIAASKGHTEIVALLLKHGANIHHVSNEGVSPLYIATQDGHTATVALLLEHHANIRQTTNEGRSPLRIAAQNGHLATVALLLDRNADISQADNNGASPLYIAAQQGYAEIVTLLLSRGAPLNQETLTKRTSLWVAAYEGHEAVVQILLANHARMISDYQGDMPLHIAVKQSHTAIVKLLLLHRASVLTVNAQKQTPLMLAARSQDPVMFSWLLAAWFQQKLVLASQEAEQKPYLEKKKAQQKVIPSQSNYNYADDSYKVVSVIAEQVLPQDSSHWALLSPAALTLAKATRQSLNLEISEAQWKLAVKLGEGAFGEVFRASLPFGPVALKRMKLERIADWFKVNLEEAHDILQWEISQLEKVRHPHVVELLSIAHSNTPLLAMELCDSTLDKTLPKTPYSEWQVAWEVACGLAYLHSLSLVHRDVKPENILLKDGIAKIADMGLAQIDPLLLDKAEPVQLQSLIGDTKWASPEEKAAFKAYHHGKGSLEDIKTVSTAATDIYRYGLVLNTFYQPIWRPIIEACLQREPKHRPSALQVLDALEKSIPHPHPVLAKLCQRLGIFAHYHQHELAHFLIPWVSLKPDIDWLTYQEGVEVKNDDAPQPFTKLWQDFLSNHDKRILDVRGVGGLGKTLLGYYQLREQWQAIRRWLVKPEGTPPTFILLLTPDYLQTSAFTLEERLAEIYQLTTEECEILKQYPVVFLFDGEDEWQARPQLDLIHWPNAKAWITGRPSATAKDSVYLLPFNQVQIVKYLNNTLAWDEATTKDFITQLPFSALKEVLRNPFVLSMFQLLWPIPNWQDLTKEAIYHRYFTQFIESQQRHWVEGPYRKIYEQLIGHLQQQHQTLAESYLRFAGEVSLQLFEVRRLEGKIEIDSPWTTISQQVQSFAEHAFREKQQLLLAKHEKTRLTLDQYQSFALAHLQRFVFPAPLELGYYRFRHKSLFEYAWAYSALLPNRSLEEDEALLKTYALIHQKEKEEKLDFSLIAASKKDPTLSRKAGNLLTMYNWARLPLAYDYRGASIENANLAYANLIQADLRNAYFKDCYFAHACIENARFDKVPDRSPQSNRSHPPLLGHSHPILYSALSPNGQLLATIDNEQVFIWLNQQRVRHFLTHIETPTALAIDDKGELLIGDNEGFLYIYSGNSRQRKLHAHYEPIVGVEIISEERCWVGSLKNNSIYHRKNYTRERQWSNLHPSVTCSVFDSLSWQHALGTQNGAVEMSSLKEGLAKNLWKYSLHQGRSTALSFSLTGNHFAAGGYDGKIVVFEQNRNWNSRILYAAHPIKSLRWAQNGQLLVAITVQGIQIWDLFGREQGNFKAATIQAIYMKNSHEGILVEQSGNLYGIALHNGELRITWVVAGEHFQGGIAIQSINEDPIKAESVKQHQQEEEKLVQQESKPNTQVLLPVLQQQGLFADKNQNAQKEPIAVTYDSAEKASPPLSVKSCCTLV